MTIHKQSTRDALLAAMATADSIACAEFARRQSYENRRALYAGADLLGDVVADMQLARPDELMAYKFPDTHSPVPVAELVAALEAAAAGDASAIKSALASYSFDNLTAVRTLAAHLRAHTQALIEHGHTTAAPDPQADLF